jgi:stress response protein YsnF
LHIKVKGSIRSHHHFTATITATDLVAVEGSGATTIRTTGVYKGSDITLSGASTINGFFCEGNSTKIKLSGASTLKNFTFTGNSMKATLSGSSNMSFDTEVEYCEVDCSGASKFEGSGYAAATSFNGSGSSSFKTLSLESENLDVDFSDASTGEVTVNNKIKGRLSGASTLKYKKATDVNVDLSGGSKLIPLD